MRNDSLTKTYIHILVITVVVFLAYANTFHVPFQWDEYDFIQENPLIKDLGYFLSPGHAKGMEQYGAFKGRYIGYLTFALNYAWGGLDVMGYHIFNLVIHTMNAFLVYFLVLLTFRTRFLEDCFMKERASGIALLSSLLFAVHPVQTEAVTYIFQRLASLAALFYLVSLVTYIKARLAMERGRGFLSFSALPWYLLCLVSAVLAMKTKENAFTLPMVLVLYEFFFFSGPPLKRLVRLVPILLTLLIIPLTLAGVSKPVGEVIGDIVPATRGFQDISRGDYLLTELRVIVTYMRLLMFPVNQNIDYDYTVFRSFSDTSVLLSFLMLMMVFFIALVLYFRSRTGIREERMVAFGILWFFITLSVESSIVPIPMLINEYRIYLPSVGAFVACITGAFIIIAKLRNEGTRKILVASLFLVPFIFAIMTHSRNAVWGTQVSLWEDAVKKSPVKARPHINLGKAYEATDRLEDAVREYSTAISLDPSRASGHYNLGVVYGELGRTADAVRELQRTIVLEPDHYQAHNNLGVNYTKLGRLEDALREYTIALNIKPDHGSSLFNMGKIFHQQGRIDKAIQRYRLAIEADPEFAEVHNNLGIAFSQIGRTEEAVQEILLAIKLDPELPMAHNNLGILYGKMGRIDDAINEFLMEIQINPDFDRAYYNLGIAYKKQGRINEAKQAFQRAVMLNPNHSGARKNLELLQAR
jgi:tetratricopeptide (TPR) repeat protein